MESCDKNGSVNQLSEFKYQKIDGIVFLKEMTHSFFPPQHSGDPARPWNQRRTYYVTSVDLRRSIVRSEVDLELPRGAHVRDSVQNRMHVVGQPEAVRPEQVELPTSHAQARSRVLVIVANFVLIGLILALWAARSRWKRS
jgi:hypothetical protein